MRPPRLATIREELGPFSWPFRRNAHRDARATVKGTRRSVGGFFGGFFGGSFGGSFASGFLKSDSTTRCVLAGEGWPESERTTFLHTTKNWSIVLPGAGPNRGPRRDPGPLLRVSRCVRKRTGRSFDAQNRAVFKTELVLLRKIVPRKRRLRDHKCYARCYLLRDWFKARACDLQFYAAEIRKEVNDSLEKSECTENYSQHPRFRFPKKSNLPWKFNRAAMQQSVVAIVCLWNSVSRTARSRVPRRSRRR